MVPTHQRWGPWPAPRSCRTPEGCCASCQTPAHRSDCEQQRPRPDGTKTKHECYSNRVIKSSDFVQRFQNQDQEAAPQDFTRLMFAVPGPPHTLRKYHFTTTSSRPSLPAVNGRIRTLYERIRMTGFVSDAEARDRNSMQTGRTRRETK